MSTCVNEVRLLGNLTRDPEMKVFPSGSKLCYFGVATNDTHVVNDEKVETVQYHNVVVWNKGAEVACSRLKKGDRVLVSGKLVHHDSKESGGAKKSDVVALNIIFL